MRHEMNLSPSGARIATDAVVTATTSAPTRDPHFSSPTTANTAPAVTAPPLYQFPVTKLRSWRTGYVRWLVLWEHEFGTLDPTSTGDTSISASALKETNRWPYRCLTEWMAIPNEPQTILLQIRDSAGSTSETTMKLWCHSDGLEREWILTRLLHQQDTAGQANTSAWPLFKSQRGTRHGTFLPVVLQVKPYGITEWHGGATQQILQTYYYCDIRAVSFPSANSSDEQHNQEHQKNGIFLYFRQPHKIRFYTIDSTAGGGRTAFLKNISAYYPTLGLDPLPMQPSMTLQQWWTQRQQMHDALGPTAMQWNVTKTSRRHDSFVVGSNNHYDTATPGGVVSRQLQVKGHGFLVEADGDTNGSGGIVHAHSLSDLCCIVRSSHDNTLLQLEFVYGKIYTYTIPQNRDAVIVSLLDAAVQQQQQHSSRNINQAREVIAHVTDRPTAGYRLLGYGGSSDAEATDPQRPKQDSKVKSLFQPTPIPLYCLKRVYTLSLHCFAVASGDLGSEPQHSSPQHRRELQHYVANLHVQPDVSALVTACREFNANVAAAPQQRPDWSIGGGAIVEKHIVGSMGALFGLVGKLLAPSSLFIEEDGEPPPPVDGRIRRDREQVAAIVFQTLYRLAQTSTGYRCSAELSTLLRDCLPTLWTIEDTYCQFGAYSVLNTLLSGTNVGNYSTTHGVRNREAEYVNKNVLLQSGGSALVNGLVSSLLTCGGEGDGSEYCYYNNQSTIVSGQATQLSISSSHQHVSDLLLMVTSDIFQSLLCSHHDTTSPEHFQHLIYALSNRYRALLSLLQSSTPFVTENTALLLHLLSTHAPSAALAIREAALSSGICLQHFFLATFSPLEGQRFLSRFLCSLWFSGPPDCDEKRLLKRMVPHGFLAYLNMPLLSPIEEEQLDQLERDFVENNIADLSAMTSSTSLVQQRNMESATASGGGAGTNTARLRSRIALAAATVTTKVGSCPENFRIFFHVLTQDHSLADLIWSQQTRRELRIALESELDYIHRETDSRGGVLAWNHQQFRVKYPSLDSEVKVGNVYMRLWLRAGDGFIRSWEEPVRLFEHLFRRFLCEVERDHKVTVMCIQCLERLYAIHAAVIGPFTDVMILVQSMTSTQSVETQHRLLGLLATVLGVASNDNDERYKIADIPENAEQLLNIESISQLCQFVAWGHTKGDQIGNMLSRVISKDMDGKPLLTNGNESGPTRSHASTNAATSALRAVDSWCPAVWFVAATGRIPPPPEMVKGPFRVSDLMEMLTTGDVTPYHFVTTSHVEAYDMDSNAGNLEEAQIDTGKWKRLNQVWQLRWQLCTDGDSDIIYSPSDIALLALKVLMRLVELHRSLDARGIPYVPIPEAKRILCQSSRDPNFASDTGGAVTSPLPIVCQALLCNDGRIVDHAAALIYTLCQHNERVVAKLYLTGVFFFVFCYTGNSVKSLAKLLHATHLKQHFKSGYAAAANDTEHPMKDRSILGNMLPEGLLFILTNYGADRFAEIFVSNADTPEVIWTFEMRKHLIEMVQQHLGDFPIRLFQNTTTEYEYCPIPGVAYHRLDKEIFCHNYYLRNLCDEMRFPDWPISQPVEVFRACLEHFKKQSEHVEKSEEVVLNRAQAVLDLKVGDGSRELRKAYRSLARKFHPDRNPAGRETFEEIQTSYEVLLPFLERGEKIRVFTNIVEAATEQDIKNDVFPANKGQMETMHLLIRAQLLICRRYEHDMAKQRYPAYSTLLRCINGVLEPIEGSRVLHLPLAKADRAAFIQSAVDLIFHTCLISPLNSEGLVAESGVPTLASLLEFYIALARKLTTSPVNEEYRIKLASTEIISNIITQSIRTLSGVAFYESGRAAISALRNTSQFFVNWRRCLDGSLFTSKVGGHGLDCPMKKYAVEGVVHLAKDQSLLDGLVGAGILWPLLKSCLFYDLSLEEIPTNCSDTGDVGVSLSLINITAKLAVQALGVLGGFFSNGQADTPVAKSLQKLLTVPVARMLRNKRTDVILRVMNTNVERADIIWNVRMRSQLESMLDKIMSDRPESMCRTLDEELEVLNCFHYDGLQNEIQIGGVYVRCFNKGGIEELSNVENAHRFFDAITIFVARSLNMSKIGAEWIEIPGEKTNEKDSCDQTDLSVSVTSPEFLYAVHALQILCRVNGLVDDILCISPCAVPSVLFSLLELSADSEAYEIGSDILSVLGPKQVFADAVTKENAFWRLLHLLIRPEAHELSAANVLQRDNLQSLGNQRKNRAWSILEALSSSPSIADEILASSSWIELLGVLVGYVKFTKLWSARVGAAKTLSRLLWDPKTGAVADSMLNQFLPATLTVCLKHDPEAMLRSFDGNSDTPELIWDASMRAELRDALGKQLEAITVAGKSNTGLCKGYVLPPKIYVRYAKLNGELYIGGVYVSRFLKEPTFNLRDPTAFLELLLHRWTKEIENYTSHDANVMKATDTAITVSGHDVMEMVTTACVLLCKVSNLLCDKLAGWGYMSRSLTLLGRVLENKCTGTPLLSIIRLLHVASDRITNVEAISRVGLSDGNAGVVECTMKAIGGQSLHPDSAFMIEFLKKTFRVALGDLKWQAIPSTVPHQPHFSVAAPSPAPGDGPVRKQKVSIGDDPLGIGPPLPSTLLQESANSVPNWSQQVCTSQQQHSVQIHYPEPAIVPSIFVSSSQHATGNQPHMLYTPQSRHQQFQSQQLNTKQRQQSEQPLNQPFPQQHYNLPSPQQQQQSASRFANYSQGLQQHHNNFHQGLNQLTAQGAVQQQSYGSSTSVQHQYGRSQSTQQQEQYHQPQELPGSGSLPYVQQQQQYPPNCQQYGQQYGHQLHQQSEQQQQGASNQTYPYQQRASIGQLLPSDQDNVQVNIPHSKSTFTYGLDNRRQQHQIQPEPEEGNFHGTMANNLSDGQHWSSHQQQTHQQKSSTINQFSYQPVTLTQPQNVNWQFGTQLVTNRPSGGEQNLHHFIQFGETNHGHLNGKTNQPEQMGISNVLNQQYAPSQPPMGLNSCVPLDRGFPVVETVQEREDFAVAATAPSLLMPPIPQFGPTPAEGVGIDARTAPDPQMTAERQASTFRGAPGAAKGRVGLLQQALACQLCKFLVDQVLEHPELLQVRDPVSVKVHTIELLKLLTKDPGYGPKFKIILDGLPAWKKYKSQDHSLLITGHEHKTDYFLTDGESSRNETKKLTEG